MCMCVRACVLLVSKCIQAVARLLQHNCTPWVASHLFLISAFVSWIAPASPILFLLMDSAVRPPQLRRRPARWAAPSFPQSTVEKVEDGGPRVLLQHPTQQVHSRAALPAGRADSSQWWELNIHKCARESTQRTNGRTTQHHLKWLLYCDAALDTVRSTR